MDQTATEVMPPWRMSRRALIQTLAGVAAAAIGSELIDPWLGAAVAGSPGEPNVVIQWNNAALQAIRETHPGPPIVSRALAIVHTCMYDAWTAYDGVAIPTQPANHARHRLAGGAKAKSKAVSFAAYRALADLFPTQLPVFDALMTHLGYDPSDSSTDASSAGTGNLCAHAVLTFRHGDRSNQLGNLHPVAYSDWTGYQPVNPPEPAPIVDPNRWQPLRVSNGNGGYVTQSYVCPQWGLVTPFALASGSEFRPSGPITTPFGNGTTPSPAYVAEARQILHLSAGLTDREKIIAEYWRDGPNSEQPPGHWCLFAQYVSMRDRHSLDEDVRLFFALSNALLDAGIAAWDAKRAYDSVRPITAIQYLYAGRQVEAWGGPCLGTQQIAGNAWQPYQPATVVTPAFPEYISGHSTFSAAAAEILRRFTASDVFGASVTIPAHSSTVEPCTPSAPVTLSWATFSDAANQAGISRRYGGIHFKRGDLAGRQVGRLVGARVWKTAQEYIRGRRP